MAGTHSKHASEGEAPQYAYALAVMSGGAAFIVSQFSRSLIACLSYTLLALIFAATWPRKPFRWVVHLCLPILLLLLVDLMMRGSVAGFFRGGSVLVKALPSTLLGAYAGSIFSTRKGSARRSYARSGRRGLSVNGGWPTVPANVPVTANTSALVKPATQAASKVGLRALPAGPPAHLAALNVALIKAAQEGDLNRVNKLLAKGADVNASVEDELAPLMIGGDFEMVKMLFGQGDASGPLGWTALMMATIEGHAEVARSLVEGGADVSVQNNNGWTPLRFAVSMGETEILRLLLGAGAQADVADPEGRTPLMQAARENVEGSLKALLEAGADPSAKDAEGRTALAIAREQGYRGIVKILEEAGAVDAVSATVVAGDYAAETALAPATKAAVTHRVIKVPGLFGSARRYEVIQASSTLPAGCEETGRSGSEEECRNYAWESSIEEQPEPGWLLGFIGLPNA